MVVRTYTLADVVDNGGGITLPTNTLDKKFGGRADTDGNSYLTILDNSRMNPSNAITIACWAYFPDNLLGIRYFLAKGSSNPAYSIRRTAIDGLSARIRTVNAGGTNYDNTISVGSVPNNTWMSLVATWSNSSNLFKLYKDTVPNGSGTATIGNLETINTQSFSLFALQNGNNKMLSGTRLAWVVVLNGEWSQTDVTNYHNGIIDIKNYPEITTIPFETDIQARPEATVGRCVIR